MKLLSLVNTKFWLVYPQVHGSIFAIWRKFANGATELMSLEEWDNEKNHKHKALSTYMLHVKHWFNTD